MAVWQSLIGNLAVVALFISGWTHAQRWLESRSRPFRRHVFALWMAAGVVSTMLLGVRLEQGGIFDLRASLLAIAGLFGGPYAALFAGGAAAAYRVLVGGNGMYVGIITIGATTAAGLVAHQFMIRDCPPRRITVLLAVAVGAINLSTLAFSPPQLIWQTFTTYSLPLTLLDAFAVLVSSTVIVHAGQLRNERNILRTAVMQAPDFFYVKDRNSRFVAVNEAVAKYNGCERPSDLTGKSDYDLTSPERALQLFTAEQEVLRQQKPIIDYEELLVDPQGAEHFFVTSKVPLHNDDGDVIGLVGITRDKTQQRATDRELRDNRNQLAFVLAEMADGLALFDEEGKLVLCNEQYHAMFPLTRDVRVPGASLASILRAAAERGEQGHMPPERLESWIFEITSGLRTGGDEEVQLFDGRWLQVRTTTKPGSGAISVVSDITAIKKAERELSALTEQLKLLATTDSLTTLMNRRAFDDCLEKEIARTRRSGLPISLIMIDIDRFKAFNDRYGHPAGDECLRRVAEILRRNVKRPADSVARYGGEEFGVILPDTDEDGAYSLAEELRKSVRGVSLEHDKSEKGVVTISLGIATYPALETRRSSLELISRADEALYTAKGAGRDRVNGWVASAAARSPAA